MKYLAILGRQPKISLAELESLFSDVRQIGDSLAEFAVDVHAQNVANLLDANGNPDINRLGGTLKIAQKIDGSMHDFLQTLPKEGKITLGVSDFSKNASAFKAQGEALKLKRILTKSGRSVRVVANKDAVLSTATSLHNGLFKPNKLEIVKFGSDFYRVTGVQDIEAYAARDQQRPARDAKVGMLPPKLAQILINLCGPLPAGAHLLDPFCGTGVVLQEAALMGYVPYGTDASERMVEYSRKNLDWLGGRECDAVLRGCAELTSADSSIREKRKLAFISEDAQNREAFAESRHHEVREPRNGSGRSPSEERACSVFRGDAPESERSEDGRERHVPRKIGVALAAGDATSFQWQPPISAVACETYLGAPMSQPPAEIKLKQEKQNCQSIILGFLKNLADQIAPETPVVIAVPAWLRPNGPRAGQNQSPNGRYERLNLLDEIEKLRYNVISFRNLEQRDLLYHREGQVVAREIIVLRKK